MSLTLSFLHVGQDMEEKTKVSQSWICPKLIIFKCTIMLSNGSLKICFLSLPILPLKDLCLFVPQTLEHGGLLI